MRAEKKHKLKLRDAAIYISLAIYIIGFQLLRINIEVPTRVARVVQLIGVMIGFISCILSIKKFRKKALLLFAGFALIALFCALPTRLTDLLYLIIILWSVQGIEIQKAYKWCLVITAISVVSVLLLFAIGLIPGRVTNEFGRIRNNLGFSSYSILPFQYLALVYGYTYLRERLLVVEIAAIEVIGYIIYKYTDVNAAFYLLTFYIVLTYILKKRPFKRLGRIRWIRYTPIALCVLSFFLLYVYKSGNSLLSNLNIVLGGRFLFAERAIEKFGIHLFGTKIDWELINETSYLIVDNAYINTVISYGIIGMVFTIGIYIYMIDFAIDNDKSVLLLIVICTLINGLLWSRILVFPEIEFILFTSILFSTGVKNKTLNKKARTFDLKYKSL